MRSEGVQCGGGREREDQRGILSFWQVLLDRGGRGGNTQTGSPGRESVAGLGLGITLREFM